MSFLDRISKVVSRGVDAAKREAERMTRIAKIRGEIRALKAEIADQEAQIQGWKMELSDKVLELFREGRLKTPELKTVVDQIEEAQGQIAEPQQVIAEKEAEIEAIRAESEEDVEEVEAEAEGEVEGAADAGVVCPKCGSAVPEGAAFCAQCGGKISE